MRYRIPEVREHLASQYVLGIQTELVRKRTERLLQEDPELEAEVYFWQTKLAHINDATPAQAPPAAV